MIVRDLRGYGFIAEADKAAIVKAVQLLDAALAEARQIVSDTGGAGGWLKAKVTGVDLDSLKAEVATMEKAVSSMHDTADRLIAADTSHERTVSFVRSAADIANISELKDSANRNSLAKMAVDVGAATVADVKKGLKIGLPLIGLAAAGILFLKFRKGT